MLIGAGLPERRLPYMPDFWPSFFLEGSAPARWRD
jgi:hypothetical protein